ncbi:MAG: glycosyltransferase [Clostridiales bacterium]|nr:glycosyltransferase [Clostridiales bacterium]
MNVTIICDVLGVPNNGTSVAAYNLINHLKMQGHNVTVVCCDADKKGESGYKIVPTMNLGPIVNAAFARNEVVPAKADSTILEDAIKGADVVHLLMPFPLSWKAVKICEKYGIPITSSFHVQAENFTCHIGMMKSAFATKEVYKYFYRKVYSHCTYTHYPTEFIKQDFESNIKKHVPSKVISNGVSEYFFEPAPAEAVERQRAKNKDKFTIVVVGRYSSEKAQQVLIKAVAKSKYKDKIHLILAGEGPKRRHYKKLVKKNGIDCEMRFFDHDELKEVLNAADLYVHTAYVELESIACLEAIVTGLVPIICNSKRSAARFFARDDRCLYQKWNSEDLKNKIEYFMENPKELEACRKKYKTQANVSRLGECMNKMEQMLEEAAETRQKEA